MASDMGTARDATYEVLPPLAMTTIFGNPGSNETSVSRASPFRLPVRLGCSGGSGLAIVDGYSRATNQPALVSLHAAAGAGQCCGAVTSWRHHIIFRR